VQPFAGNVLNAEIYVMVGRQVGKELVAENANVMHKHISFRKGPNQKKLIASLALPAIKGDKPYVVYHKLRKWNSLETLQ
jgi:hypothetical protein